MENFIYSLNATVPVFVVMLVGWLLRKKGMLNQEFCTVANDFNFKITLPVLLFQDISEMDFYEMFDARYVLFCAVATTLCFGCIWLGAEIFMKKEPESIGSFVQGSFRGSAAVLGVAFLTNIYGTVGMLPMMIIGSVPLYNIFSVLVLTLKGKGQQAGDRRQKMKTALVNICKNPIILGILVGMPFSLLRITLPAMVEKSLDNFSAMASPLALIVIGASFEGTKALAKIKPTLISAAIKLVVQPAIFLPMAIAMGFRGEALVPLLVMLGAPTTPSTYIMAKSMGNDEVLSSSIVVVTVILSSVTVTAWVFLLRSMGVI